MGVLPHVGLDVETYRGDIGGGVRGFSVGILDRNSIRGYGIGLFDDVSVGTLVGVSMRFFVGISVGRGVDDLDGSNVVGKSVGDMVGFRVRCEDGFFDGFREG